MLWLAARSFVAMASTNSDQTATPSTPREFYNAGTVKLQEGKLREAEAFLENALASQDQGLQPPTLYNLGHVRFRQGEDERKKGPPAGPAAARARAAARHGDQALQAADEALAGNDLQQMVTAYLRGRGVRKELKTATEAVRQALASYGSALNRWQRASGDFHSTVELTPSDAEARENAEIVDRSIAKLIDSLQQLQQAKGAMGSKSDDLREKLKQLKGRIPEQDMPPGASGDEEDEEDQPLGPQSGQKEAGTKEGQQQDMSLSPEQASWLLDGFKLDSERRLPMGQDNTGQRKTPSNRTW